MNLLLIDETIPSKELFIEGINEDTKFITYSITDTFEKLTEKINNFNIDSFSNVAFVFVDDRTPLKMFVSYNTFISYSGDVINQNNTTDFIKNLVSKYSVKNLDFLACNLLSYDIWKRYFEFIMNDNEGLIVRASNDRTGNLNSGGDWIMESTNEDISKLYFNDKISNWNNLLDSSSYYNSAFLGIDGSVHACGNNSYGQLNNYNYASNQLTFLNITSSDDNILMVSCGDSYTGILKQDGSVWMCGFNNFGQLGNGNSSGFNPNPEFQKSIDIDGSEISDAIAISCGSLHTGIIKQDGSVWMCGSNGIGQLGDGSDNIVPNTKFKKSIDISDNDISDAVAISCGYYYTGIIKQDGSVWMCGENRYGQLGNDFNINTSNPNPKFKKSIDINDMDISGAIAISCGNSHTGIIKQDGSVWMCGENRYGQLGDGSNNVVPNPYFKKSIDMSNNDISDAIAISCGNSHTGIIKQDGSVWMCGLNNFGQLGDDSNNNVPNPYFKKSIDISDMDISNAVAISCGGLHTGIVKQDGSVWMCGRNNFGQLGNGTTTNSNLFIPTTFVGKAKYTNIPYKDISNNDSNFVIIQNTDNIYTYFPDMISKELLTINTTDYSTTFNGVITTNSKIIISLEPANTVFTNYVYFDVPVSSTIDLEVYFKSETDTEPRKLTNFDTSYGAYYDISNSSVRIYTKHFSEVGIGYTQQNIPCLTKNTTVLTPFGYVKVHDLKIGDLITTSDNRDVPITNIFRTFVKGTRKTYPYIIRKSSIAPNYPPSVSRISKGHLIKHKNNWIHPKYSNKFQQDKSKNIITYYHIETPSYEHDTLVIDGGLVVETFGGDSYKNVQIWKKRVSRYFISKTIYKKLKNINKIKSIKNKN